MLGPTVGSRQTENPKVFYYSAFSKWVLLTNMIEPGGQFTDYNCLLLSATSTGFTFPLSDEPAYFQTLYYPNTSNAKALGCASHLIGPDGLLIEENGFVPIVWDADPTQESPGWHIFRKGRIGYLEPWTTSLSYSNLTGTPHQARKTLSHTDIVAEYVVRFTNYPGGTSYTGFQFRSNGTAGYELRVRATSGANWLALHKMDGTLIQNGTATHAGTLLGVDMTVQISCIGTTITASIGGEQQISVTDSTYASGTEIGMVGCNIAADTWLVRAYSSNTVTINGLPSSTGANIRGPAGIPWDQDTIDNLGVLTYDSNHYPLSGVEVASLPGIDAKPSGGKLWPGTYAYVPDPVPSTRVGFI